jgi:hypothetical protein
MKASDGVTVTLLGLSLLCGIIGRCLYTEDVRGNWGPVVGLALCLVFALAAGAILVIGLIRKPQ